MTDVEEYPGGAISNYVAISDIVQQMQERGNAMRACHSYYISHAYLQVRSTSRRAIYLVWLEVRRCPHPRLQTCMYLLAAVICCLSKLG